MKDHICNKPPIRILILFRKIYYGRGKGHIGDLPKEASYIQKEHIIFYNYLFIKALDCIDFRNILMNEFH